MSTRQSVKHSLWQEHPGEVVLDAWGWHAPIYYQRSMFDNKSVDLDYFKKRVIEESYRWGANLLELYPPAGYAGSNQGSYPFCWANDDPIKRPKGYRYIKDEKWTTSTFKELISYAHQHGMLIQWYCHPELVPGLDEELLLAGVKKKDFKKLGLENLSREEAECYIKRAERFSDRIDGRTAIIFNKDRIKENLDAVSKLSRDFANSLDESWKDNLDGYGYEHGFIDLKGETNTRLWGHNSGMYIYTSTHCTPPTFSPIPVTPNLSFVFCCGQAGIDDQTFNLDSFVSGKRFPIHLRKLYVTYQSNSRTFSNTEFGGGLYPDWFLKQCNDFFRPRLVNSKEKMCPSAIWWLNEAENICWDGIREYVYAVSQDPIKCAFTTTLATTGNNGWYERKFNKKLGYFKHPSETFFIQNNYLRLYLSPKEEKSELVYDPERLAHYDSNSHSFPLTTKFISIRSSSKMTNYKKQMWIREFGGRKAVLNEYIRVFISGVSILKEIRTYSMIGDTCYFDLSIKRSITGSPQDIDTLLGCEGYDRLIIADKRYNLLEKKLSLSPLPDIIHLQDSTGKTPDLFILLLVKGNIKELNWEPSKRLVLRSPNVSEENLRLVIAVPTDLYKEKQLFPLREALIEGEPSITLKQGRGEASNKYSIPLVEVLKVTNPNLGSYFIEEYGWWMFRGAQPSEEDNKETDYVKVYLKANGKVRLQQKEYINDILKPGWGCQYIMAIRDIEGNNQSSSCTVKVFSVTSFIFAPRIEFKKDIASAKVNGKPWHYFEGNILFLPNKEAIYEVEVNHRGGMLPHLRRTFAYIEETKWEDNIFEFKGKLPVWVKSMPEGQYFTATLDLGKRKLKDLEGAQVIRESSQGIIIGFEPGKVKVFTTR